ncbi:MAG: membrane integrity-associated transporter subunit PqiC [Betaproteobacteria bacterium]|nr:MAG: membrane integrity-associated transporter subunit PqiC [Betaproteobacteria bacterium]
MKPNHVSARRKPWACLLSVIAGTMLAGCSSSPPIHYYTLSAPAAGSVAPRGEQGPSLVVGPVSIPAEVDRQQMVRIVDGVRLEVASQHRWAGPLKIEIGRRVAGEIARLRGLPRVVAWPQNTYSEPELSLPIDIQRLDTIGFDSVRIEAVWSLRRERRELAGGRVVIEERIDDPSHAGVAVAHVRAVDALAREVAARMPGV